MKKDVLTLIPCLKFLTFSDFLTESEFLTVYWIAPESYAFFRKHLLSLIRPEANNIFNVHNAKGIRLLTRLQVGLVILRNTNFESLLNQQHTFFFTVLTFPIKDWLSLTKSKLSITDNKSILEVKIQSLISSGRFDSPLY